MKDFEKNMVQNALDRVLKYARDLAYPDKEEVSRRGPYRTLQHVAICLDGLQSAVVDYDQLLEAIEQSNREG